MKPVWVFVIALTLFHSIGAGPGSSVVCSRDTACQRVNFLATLNANGEAFQQLVLAVSQDELLMVTRVDLGDVSYQQGYKSVGSKLVGFDPEYKIRVYQFFEPKQRLVLFQPPDFRAAQVAAGTYVHSHEPVGSDIEVVRPNRVVRVGPRFATLSKPLLPSQLGAVFFTKEGKFAGIGALAGDAEVLVLPSALQDFIRTIE